MMPKRHSELFRTPSSGAIKRGGGNQMGGVSLPRQILSVVLGILLVSTIEPGAATGSGYQSSGTAPATSAASDYSGQGVPATAEELQALVAPIALYPDALVAQILSAATFPDQVAVAS